MSLLESSMTYGERLSLAGQVTLIGLATVFSVLIILMIALYLFQLFSYTLPQKRKKRAEISQTVTNTQIVEEITKDELDNTQLIAVITAAITEYELTVNQNTTSFHVVSFKRKYNKTSWNGDNGIDD